MTEKDAPLDSDGGELRELQPERLSLAHLFVWTALSAVLLAFDRATSQAPTVEISNFGRIMAFFYAPLFGASVSALGLMAWRLTNGGPRFPVQPGHWLLVISGVQSLLHLSIGVIQATAPLGFSWELLLLGRLCDELACGTLLWLACRDTRRMWRVAFVIGFWGCVFGLVNTTCVLVWVVTPALFYAEFFVHWVVMMACLIAVCGDLATQPQRDYLHWTGIVVRLTYLSLVTAAPYLLRWLNAQVP